MVMGVIVTVPGNENSLYDAFSRFFAPLYGVNEDPVTGETHLFLAILCHTYRTKHSIEPDPVSTDTGCHYKKKNQLPAPKMGYANPAGSVIAYRYHKQCVKEKLYWFSFVKTETNTVNTRTYACCFSVHRISLKAWPCSHLFTDLVRPWRDDGAVRPTQDYSYTKKKLLPGVVTDVAVLIPYDKRQKITNEIAFTFSGTHTILYAKYDILLNTLISMYTYRLMCKASHPYENLISIFTFLSSCW